MKTEYAYDFLSHDILNVFFYFMFNKNVRLKDMRIKKYTIFLNKSIRWLSKNYENIYLLRTSRLDKYHYLCCKYCENIGKDKLGDNSGGIYPTFIKSA